MAGSTVDVLVERCAGDRQPIVVVTRTRRLARSLRLRVAEHRVRDGVAVAEAPPIRTLDEWMAELADRIAPGRWLLKPAIENALWQQVIAEAGGDDGAGALDLRALAEQAAQAHQRLCAWGEPDWEGQPLSRDAAAFRGWLVLFRRRLSVSRWVVAAELPPLFAAALESGALGDLRPPAVALVGFERLEPVVERIAAALDGAGSAVEIVATAGSAAAPVVVREAATPRDELRAVARQIHARLLENPRLRIGVLAPDIDELRVWLERVLEEELEAADLLEPGGERARCFEVSAAPRMSDYPLIANALDLLALRSEEVAFEHAGRVLLAPYPRLGDSGAEGAPDDECEFEGRALAETELRRRNLACVPLRSDAASHGLSAITRRCGATVFAKRLEDLASLLRREPFSASPGRWRVHFIHRLDAMHWPGVLGSEVEGIVFRRWQDALAELATMEVLAPSMTAAEALGHLRSICVATTVQASSEGPPVQAMGLLDAAGLEFDVVYAIGMTSTAFPAAARPHPLLPVLWQRQAGHPRASAEGERKFAELVWRRVRGSTRELIASYAVCDQSGERKSASALLQLGVGVVEESPAAWAWWAAPPGAEAYREPRPFAPASPALMRRGSAALIGNQAACPFRAFATHRLGAETLRGIEVQPDPSLRGSLVHAALEEVYRRVRDRQALAALSDGNLQELVDRCADIALANNGAAMEGGIRHFVRDWLIELVSNWLRFEREDRRDAWVIQEVESPRAARLPRGDAQGIEFHVRLDRVDRLESGGLLLIDFKTSATGKSTARWAGERPDEPQLPLYATLLANGGSRIEGLAFANLAARDACSLIGLAAAQLGARLGPAGVRRSADGAAAFCGDFAVDLAAMQQRVEALAREYLHGDARVAPKKPQVCNNCGMQALCRVFENDTSEIDEADAEES